MKGHFYRRGCTCNKKRCSCGSTWTFVVDIGIDPKTGKRRQKSKGGFKTKQDAIASATALVHTLNTGLYIEESHVLFKDFAQEWLIIYSETTNVKPGTIRVRRHEVAKLMPYLANFKLKDITLKKLSRYFK